MLDMMNYKKVGGALLLGVNTIAVKAHGNSDEESFLASMMVAYNLIKNGVVEKIKKNFLLITILNIGQILDSQ